MAKKKKYQKTPFEESAKEQMIALSDRSKIRVLSFTEEKNPREDIAVFFIPGMFSIFPRWEPVVQALKTKIIQSTMLNQERKSLVS